MESTKQQSHLVQDRWSSRLRFALSYLPEHGVSKTFTLVRQYGLKNSYRFVLRNTRYLIGIYFNKKFDKRHNIDTSGATDVQNLIIESQNREFGNEFLSTSVKSFHFISKYFPRNIPEFIFIDYGAGKGRTLLLSSTLGFKEVIGVEYAEDLVQTAQRNIKSFRHPRILCGRISMMHADATSYNLPQENCVLYFYNPFSINIMEQVLTNIEKSYLEHPREIYIVYAGPPMVLPAVRDLIVGTKVFARIPTKSLPFYLDAVLNHDFMVFKTKEGG